MVDVALADGSQQRIRYDHILLGIGSVDSNAIAGIQSFGYQIKAHEAFRRTKETIPQLVQQAVNTDAGRARKLLTFTVAGGGFTGVEMATNIVEFVNVLKKEYPSLQAVSPTVRLVHSGERVLTALHPRYPRLVRNAEKTLKEYGIEVINNRRIIQVSPEGAFLDDNSFIASRMVISTVGQSRMLLGGTDMLLRDNQQRLLTNRYQQISGLTNVWGWR